MKAELQINARPGSQPQVRRVIGKQDGALLLGELQVGSDMGNDVWVYDLDVGPYYEVRGAVGGKVYYKATSGPIGSKSLVWDQIAAAEFV